MSYLNKIKRLFSPTVETTPIPSYEEKRSIIEECRKKFDIKIFVETGTFLGDTTDFFKEKFDSLYSIELSEELALRATKRFEENKNIQIIQGDSGIILSSLVPTLDKPALFWLDGHYSSEFFHEGEYFVTAKAEINTPVEKELDTILKSGFMHVILIDDARLFVGEHDYPALKTITEKVRASKKNYKVYVEKDIIYVIPF